MNKEIDLLTEIEKTIKDRKKILKKKEEKKKQPQTITKQDLENLLKKFSRNTQTEPVIIQPITTQETTQPVQQKQPTKDQQIAYGIYKDAKATSIVCIIAMILPIIVALISMFPNGMMLSIMIAFIGMIYPILILMKARNTQIRAYIKYGYKPISLLQMPQQQQNINQTEGRLF